MVWFSFLGKVNIFWESNPFKVQDYITLHELASQPSDHPSEYKYCGQSFQSWNRAWHSLDEAILCSIQPSVVVYIDKVTIYIHGLVCFSLKGEHLVGVKHLFKVQD